MASIYESSEQVEQEKQDYLYGVVRKERSKMVTLGKGKYLTEGWWCLTDPHFEENYCYIFAKVTKKSSTLYYNFKNVRHESKSIDSMEYFDKTFHRPIEFYPLTPAELTMFVLAKSIPNVKE